MGVFDKFLDVMRLNDEDYDDYEDDYEDEYEDEVEESARKRFFFKKTGNDDVQEEAVTFSDAPSRNKGFTRATRSSSSAGSASNITPIRGRKSSKSMEVCVIKPTGFEDSKEISETLLANRMVVLNMDGMDTGTAQRIIDFISGSCYAIDGDLQQISNCIFLVTPRTVGVSGDFQELQGLMDTFNFSGLQAAI